MHNKSHKPRIRYQFPTRKSTSVLNATARCFKNLVDRDVDELDEEADEAHHEEPNAGGEGNLGELGLIGLLTFCDELHAVFVELPSREKPKNIQDE